MRKAELKGKSPLQIEKEADEKRRVRQGGFGLMADRDSGATLLSNGVVVRWTPAITAEPLPALYDRVEFTPKGGAVEIVGIKGAQRIPVSATSLVASPPAFPDNHIEIDGKLYDAEELRSWLRWA